MKYRATITCCPIQLGSISSLRCQKSRNLLSIQTSKMRSDVSRTILGARSVDDQTIWWSQTGSNRRPHACKARALPAELWPRNQKTNARLISPPSPRLRHGTAAFVSKGLPGRSSEVRRLVGLGRLELPTSRLSSARSNQLSYKPLTHIPLRTRDPAHTGPARVRPRRKRNVDGEIPPMQLNDPDDRWPLMFLKRSDSEPKLAEGSSLERR